MAEGAVVLLEGWIPEDQEADVKKLLDDSGVYYEIRKATKEDNAPIKLKNNEKNGARIGVGSNSA